MIDGMSEPTLDDYLAEHDGLDPAIEANKRIPNKQDEQAARALREMGRLRARIDANKAAAERERAKITTWETTVNEPLQTRYAWLHSLLTAYAINERNLDPSRKTIQTPYGHLATKPAQRKWKIDPDKFTAWAKEHAPDLIKITTTPKLAEVKKAYRDADGKAVDMFGQVAEGVTIEDPENPFTVDVKPE
jgi:hypothetical protein